MKKILNQSLEVQNRIDTIQADIKQSLKSIKRLKALAKYPQIIDRASHVPRLIEYIPRIPKSERYFQWALQTTATQIRLLEAELKTLIYSVK
ncbi:MAG: hypothetical protein K0R24_1722 [Gammaproteobacteria bacterium]|jgi:hypothetical protein|nr:hypothetical protein [Gammaproteobacteria bacterium]